MLPPAQAEPRFGYLLVLEDPQEGWTGGYLVVSRLGRPIEFHCTEPIFPSRAEEILYGPTLRAHLVGERIAPALCRRAKERVDVLFSQDQVVAETGREVGLCTAVLDELEELGGADRPTPTPDHAEARRMIDRLAEAIDLAEPFERVREAIAEVKRIGREGSCDDLHAA